MAIILASQSPRRKELLGLLNIPFTVRVAEVDETLDPELSLRVAVLMLSRRKARAVPREKGDIVIAADTVVVCDGNVLGKPVDEADAFRMLRMLSGRMHKVITGFSVLRDNMVDSYTEITDIYFRNLSDEEIRAYIATGDPMDKAGAYGIQSGGALFVKRISGDYYNVVGLPVCSLNLVLKKIMEEDQ